VYKQAPKSQTGGRIFLGLFVTGDLLALTTNSEVVSLYLDLPRGAEWMIRGAEKHHPLGFKQYPLEDAGK